MRAGGSGTGAGNGIDARRSSASSSERNAVGIGTERAAGATTGVVTWGVGAANSGVSVMRIKVGLAAASGTSASGAGTRSGFAPVSAGGAVWIVTRGKAGGVWLLCCSGTFGAVVSVAGRVVESVVAESGTTSGLAGAADDGSSRTGDAAPESIATAWMLALSCISGKPDVAAGTG